MCPVFDFADHRRLLSLCRFFVHELSACFCLIWIPWMAWMNVRMVWKKHNTGTLAPPTDGSSPNGKTYLAHLIPEWFDLNFLVPMIATVIVVAVGILVICVAVSRRRMDDPRCGPKDVYCRFRFFEEKCRRARSSNRSGGASGRAIDNGRLAEIPLEEHSIFWNKYPYFGVFCVRVCASVLIAIIHVKFSAIVFVCVLGILSTKFAHPEISP